LSAHQPHDLRSSRDRRSSEHLHLRPRRSPPHHPARPGARDLVLAELENLGGAALTAQTSRAPLTWSAQSLHTNEEHAHDQATGSHGPTGRHQASVAIVIAVRDFALLESVPAALTGQDCVDVQSVSWSVDDDNPQWALVRAEAIDAAIVKGQDYAAALGGTVIGLEHVADSGLVGGDSARGGSRAFAAAGLPAGGRGEDTSLDPVPQVLSATIEARFTAVIGAIGSR
jgi:hypothetical protein